MEHTYIIYMGGMMKGSLANTLKSEENGIHIYIRTKMYYPDDSDAQTFTLLYGKIIPILYYVVQPYIPVWRPTPEEIDSCICVFFTLRKNWDPFLLGTSLNDIAPLFLFLSLLLNSLN